MGEAERQLHNARIMARANHQPPPTVETALHLADGSTAYVYSSLADVRREFLKPDLLMEADSGGLIVKENVVSMYQNDPDEMETQDATTN